MAIKEIGHQLSSKNTAERIKEKHYEDMMAIGPPDKTKWHYQKKQVRTVAEDNKITLF
jgi:hypothetical protein